MHAARTRLRSAWRVLPGLFLALLWFSPGGPLRGARAAEAGYRDLYPDTWVATDALGRTMPGFSEVGPVKRDHRRVVGIFYITWHSDSMATLKPPYRADVSRVLAADPKARLDAKHPLWTEGSYHWGEPEMGYFLSKDAYVIRKDMSMLADAGVDVLVVDVTNAVRYWDEWEAIFAVIRRMKAEGNQAPQFCFWAFNGPVITVVQDLYDRIYKAGKYKDLWFLWDAKPLLLYNGNPSVDANGAGPQNPNPHFEAAAKTDPQHPHYGDPDYTEAFYKDYTKEVKSFFTLRTMWWGYFKWAGKRFVGTEDNWSFGLDLGDQHVRALSPDERVSRHNGRKEEAAVTPAQHPSSLIGKSWTASGGEPALNEYDLPLPTSVPWLGKVVEHPEGYGIYFQQRWDEALAGDPEFLYLNDWNEWTAGKYSPPGGGTTKFMRRDSPYFFVDQYDAEFNRTLQPMKGGYTDNYYMQMAGTVGEDLYDIVLLRINGVFWITVKGPQMLMLHAMSRLGSRWGIKQGAKFENHVLANLGAASLGFVGVVEGDGFVRVVAVDDVGNGVLCERRFPTCEANAQDQRRPGNRLVRINRFRRRIFQRRGGTLIACGRCGGNGEGAKGESVRVAGADAADGVWSGNDRDGTDAAGGTDGAATRRSGTPQAA